MSNDLQLDVSGHQTGSLPVIRPPSRQVPEEFESQQDVDTAKDMTKRPKSQYLIRYDESLRSAKDAAPNAPNPGLRVRTVHVKGPRTPRAAGVALPYKFVGV
jgi:hypothetical protein